MYIFRVYTKHYIRKEEEWEDMETKESYTEIEAPK